MSQDTEMTMVEHLAELRRVLIISLASTFVMAIACMVFADRVLEILLEPVSKTGNQMVYINVTEALMTKISLSFFLGFLAALPIILWQFWGFIIPALRKMERVYFTLFITISYLLFIAGILFGFFGVYHLGIKFLMEFGGPELLPMITIGNYISFTIKFLLPFGLVFELPLAALFLAQLGLISYKFMTQKRKYAVLIAVVISAAIIPTPDMITPLLMASPMIILYEISAQIVRFIEWRKRKKAKQQEESEPEESEG
ncbi:sec-independent protein translocase protein TatC [Desulfohalotomaculum tongense]|uniref:twin-arginine translocase subunit TatC n=1 Tax=Desulforadius tongensis TaxID=1216062 RepID=UPI00195E0B6E|nr:twin-arginine translocase subunit TatC [Desulforadius tongensis]MBM7855343.1 sec-independent protein translocase protein TatC [Desulforadius tongensis]